ncbi:MAG: FliM/FliN family flagellar motor switch protein [Puniceicoccales bacterium]|jgi:flagellar motor switch/type III secretory pathway protein FliN|nr:FliM/FliN family flagellar motor switch protein [Puniceicoccales bacterium]
MATGSKLKKENAHGDVSSEDGDELDDELLDGDGEDSDDDELDVDKLGEDDDGEEDDDEKDWDEDDDLDEDDDDAEDDDDGGEDDSDEEKDDEDVDDSAESAVADGTAPDGVDGDDDAPKNLDKLPAEEKNVVEDEEDEEEEKDSSDEDVDNGDGDDIGDGMGDGAIGGDSWPIHERAEAMLKDVAYAALAPRPREGFDVGAIEVSLTFDLGTLRISLRDLESIKEGYSFTLERPNDEHVAIRANGQPIGRGRLVNIDGRVGVQIVELNG